MSKFDMLLNQVDCQCGAKLLLLDRAKSPIAPKRSQIRELKRAAQKRMKRQLIVTDGELVCPSCKQPIDTSKPDERLHISNGEVVQDADVLANAPAKQERGAK
jgi:hypothetical protein